MSAAQHQREGGPLYNTSSGHLLVSCCGRNFKLELNTRWSHEQVWRRAHQANQRTHLRTALIGRLYRPCLDLARLSVPSAKMSGLLHWPLPLPELRRRVVKHPARSPMPVPALKHLYAFEALHPDGHLLHLPIDEYFHSELVGHTVGGIALGRPTWCRRRGWIAA